jgi:hypothetical protein
VDFHQGLHRHRLRGLCIALVTRYLCSAEVERWLGAGMAVESDLLGEVTAHVDGPGSGVWDQMSAQT